MRGRRRESDVGNLISGDVADAVGAYCSVDGVACVWQDAAADGRRPP